MLKHLLKQEWLKYFLLKSFLLKQFLRLILFFKYGTQWDFVIKSRFLTCEMAPPWLTARPSLLLTNRFQSLGASLKQISRSTPWRLEPQPKFSTIPSRNNPQFLDSSQRRRRSLTDLHRTTYPLTWLVLDTIYSTPLDTKPMVTPLTHFLGACPERPFNANLRRITYACPDCKCRRSWAIWNSHALIKPRLLSVISTWYNPVIQA